MQRYIMRAVTVTLALALGGCALFGGDEGGERPAGEERSSDAGTVVARDLVAALVQIDGYAPEATVVRFDAASVDDDEVLAALERVMRAEGYAVRLDAGPAPGQVTHSAEPGDGSDTVHTISVGEVQLRRRYAPLADGGWAPSGSLFVRGADASGITLDAGERATRRAAKAGEERERPRTRPPAAPATAPTLTPAPIPAPAPAPVPLGAGETRADAAAPDAGGLPATPRRRAERGSAPLAIDRVSGKPVYSGLVGGSGAVPMKRNVMDLGGSNFAGVFDHFVDVEEVILTFPNDSLTLGTANKATIRRTLELFEPSSDRFAIVGCSLGPTKIENGNAALALGRANRVKEELLFAGVSADRILDEGCWAGEAATRFPSRGVVLTLKRELS